LGGTFAGLWSLLWWPWTFWTFGIALACLGGMSYWILPAVPLKEEEQGLTFTQRLHELDLLGATVGITAMILFNFAWNQAPGFGWEQPYIYALLIVGFLLFPVFFWIELRVSEHPLIPFDALKTDVIFVMVCEMCGWAAFGMFFPLRQSHPTDNYQESSYTTSSKYSNNSEERRHFLPWPKYVLSLSPDLSPRSPLVMLFLALDPDG
jgi:MFS family permease